LYELSIRRKVDININVNVRGESNINVNMRGDYGGYIYYNIG
jgi:hypothetical protein